MTTEEDNYVRFSLFMTGISSRAVRCKFNNLFPNLPNTVQTEYNKLDDLKKKKRITSAQWDLLYPSSGIPDSSTFDVTLMICLMRNLLKMKPPSNGFDCLPPLHEISVEADLARIKFYRNQLAHQVDAKINNQDFTSAWADVADAVGRLGGNTMLQECKDLKVKTLDRSNKEIMIEIKKSSEEIKQMQHSNANLKRSLDNLQIVVKKHKASHKRSNRYLQSENVKRRKETEKLRKVQTEEIEKLKEVQKDPVPCNIRGQINKKLETWKEDDKMFVVTRASTCVLDSRTTPLMQCCIVGDINTVQWLCDHGVDVNHCNSKKESPLYISCDKGRLGIVTTLLNNKADVNQCDEDGESPLYRACFEGYTKIVTTLLDNKADVNQCTRRGGSPLYITCCKGYTEIVTTLLNNKADVNQCNWLGASPLYTACEEGYTEIVTTLLNNKADVNQCNDNGESPLFRACREGYNEIVTTLLNNKADVNQCTEWGKSPLYAACEVWSELLRSNDRYIELDYLYDGEIEVNSENKDRYSNTVKLLMNAGADYTLCTKEGESPLDLFEDQDIIDKILSWK